MTEESEICRYLVRTSTELVAASYPTADLQTKVSEKYIWRGLRNHGTAINVFLLSLTTTLSMYWHPKNKIHSL
jgi:hypothetical protein